MTDTLRAAIIAEIKRQANADGAWYLPPADAPPIGWVAEDGPWDRRLSFDGDLDVDALCRVIRATLGWRPIDTAPKDGEPFLGLIDHGDGAHEVLRMAWVEYAQRFGDATYAPFVEDQVQPTHWQPMPAPQPQTPTTGERMSGFFEGLPCDRADCRLSRVSSLSTCMAYQAVYDRAGKRVDAGDPNITVTVYRCGTCGGRFANRTSEAPKLDEWEREAT